MLVISPFNALIRDQIVKIREGGLNVCVLKGDCVTGDDDRDDVPLNQLNVPVEMLLNFTYDLMFAHTEVVVDSKKVAKLVSIYLYDVQWLNKEQKMLFGVVFCLSALFQHYSLIDLAGTNYVWF